ncbi:MAG: hypothetical protein V3S05_09070 [Desulfobacterales bacterium]
MKDKRSQHLKLQELCDCFVTTDPLKEMSEIENDGDDTEEAALKWIALAALHGLNNNAKKISITKVKGGQVKVIAEYRNSELPSPGARVGEKVIQTIREITHLEGEKGKTQLALGLRDSSFELGVKLKTERDEEKVTLKFP